MSLPVLFIGLISFGKEPSDVPNKKYHRYVQFPLLSDCESWGTLSAFTSVLLIKLCRSMVTYIIQYIDMFEIYRGNKMIA